MSLFSIVVFVLLDAGEAGSSRGRLADVDGSWSLVIASLAAGLVAVFAGCLPDLEDGNFVATF